MPFFQNQTREELRSMYVQAWRKRRDNLPVEPVEAQIADVIEAHPEYHAMLHPASAALNQEFTPQEGATNPFLHMGLHLAVRDQVATDRPLGIRGTFAQLAAKLGSAHDAEHAMIDVLAEGLWNAQRSGLPPDERRYVEQVQRLAGK